MSGKILVTGAAGFLGSHLIEALLERGRSVRAVVRSGGTPLPRDLAHRVELVEARLDEPGALDRHLGGVSVVYHLAGCYLPGNSGETLSQLRLANVEITRNVLNSALFAGVPRFVHVSSAAACGRCNEEVITEESGQPDGAYGLAKKESEQLFLTISSAKLRWTILRPTVVFGDREGLVVQLAGAIRSGRFVLLGNGGNFVNLIHVRGVINALLKVEAAESTCGKIYLLADRPIRFAELVEIIRDSVNAPPVRRLPAVLGWMGALACETVARLTGKKMPLSLNAVRFMTRSTEFSGAKLRLDAGIEPSVGVAEGVRKTLCGSASAPAAVPS
jgi:nucleoside-diphosphate-sugar epimerase